MESATNLLEIVSLLRSQDTRSKITAFLYTRNKLIEIEFLKILLKIATKYMKYLGVNITRYALDLKSTKHCREKLNQIYTNGEIIICLLTGRLNC